MEGTYLIIFLISLAMMAVSAFVNILAESGLRVVAAVGLAFFAGLFLGFRLLGASWLDCATGAGSYSALGLFLSAAVCSFMGVIRREQRMAESRGFPVEPRRPRQ
jgi:hypothetical protein